MGEKKNELWKVEGTKMQRTIKSELMGWEQAAEVPLKIYY